MEYYGGISLKCIPKYIVYYISQKIKGVVQEGWVQGHEITIA
jgi:hypothetical protein